MNGPFPQDPVYETESDPADWAPLTDADQTRAVAEYLADMIGQLEDMARRSRLDLLVYLLSMAKSEAQASARAGVTIRPDA